MAKRNKENKVSKPVSSQKSAHQEEAVKMWDEYMKKGYSKSSNDEKNPNILWCGTCLRKETVCNCDDKS